MKFARFFWSRLFLIAAFSLVYTGIASASDHGDSPINSGDQNIDQGDTYLFLDPNDNSRAVAVLTVRGFITPGEAVNFAYFDHRVRYRFEFEKTGDAKPDLAINVTFTQRVSTSQPQTAIIDTPFGRDFTALTTLPTQSAAPNNQTITTDPRTGIKFFAGEVDDPFFFDVTGFSRFAASVRAGSPDATQLARGRDTFAGYNILAIALSIPVSLFGSVADNTLGVQSLTQRRASTKINKRSVSADGVYRTLDRSGNPALNALVIPFGRKDEYNFSTPVDDARGKFAADIISTLQLFGANSTSINTLAGIYVARGDYIRVNLTTANSGLGGGNNAGAGFPNGRRLGDDVADTFLTVVANGATLGDGVDSNDVPFSDTFPFLAPPHQPAATGTIDDDTRN